MSASKKAAVQKAQQTGKPQAFQNVAPTNSGSAQKNKKKPVAK